MLDSTPLEQNLHQLLTLQLLTLTLVATMARSDVYNLESQKFH